MALLWINNISLGFGGPLLRDSASLQIEAGERIGLLDETDREVHPHETAARRHCAGQG